MFEIFIRNAITDRYNLMCFVDEHEKQQTSYVDGGRSSCGKAIPSNLTTEALYSPGSAFDFIDCWLNFFDQHYQAI